MPDIASGKFLSKIPFSTIYKSKKYKYIITPGNNSKLIREAMKRRSWWIEIPNFNFLYNFKWQPVSNGIKFSDLDGLSAKQIVNHFEFHKEISTKSRFFQNMKSYWEGIKYNVFDIMPLTFLLI